MTVGPASTSMQTFLSLELKLVIDHRLAIFSKNLLSGVGLAGSSFMDVARLVSMLYLLLKLEGVIPISAAALVMSPFLLSKTSCISANRCCSSVAPKSRIGAVYFFAPIIDKKAFLLSLSLPVQASTWRMFDRS